MEIVRNQRLKLSQRVAVDAASAKKRIANRVDVKAGKGRSACERDPLSLEIGPNLRDGRFDGVHAPEESTINCLLQQPGQRIALENATAQAYRDGMSYDPEPIRRAIRRVMKEKNLDMAPWCEAAGIGRNTLRMFMNARKEDKTRSLTIRSLTLLADVAGVHVCDLLGLESSGEPSVDASARRAIIQLIEKARKDYADSEAALDSAEDLLRGLGRDDPVSDPPLPRRRRRSV